MQIKYIVYGTFLYWLRLTIGLLAFDDSMVAVLNFNKQLQLIDRVSDIRIEPYTYSLQDFNAIKEIAQSNIVIGTQSYSYAQLLGRDNAEELWSMYDNTAYIQQHLQRFIVKTKSNIVIGFGAVGLDHRHAGFHILLADETGRSEESWAVYGMAIHPEYRRFGIGKRLFDRMAHWAEQDSKSRGLIATYLYIECLRSNTYACNAYKQWTDSCRVGEKTIVCQKELMTGASTEFKNAVRQYRLFNVGILE